MKRNQKTRRFGALTIYIIGMFVAVFLLLPFGGFLKNTEGRYALKVLAETSYDTPSIQIERYDVEMRVQSDRKVVVEEQITVRFLKHGLSMFYRTLPKEGTRYYDVTASCEENAAFSYNVKENPDMDGFLDINCIGGAEKGNVWTYDISYTMESGKDFGDGIIIDVIGFGWPVALHNVTARVFLPDTPLTEPKLYIGAYGESQSDTEVVVAYSNNNQTIELSAEKLPLRFNSTYYETMAEGITLECDFEAGVFVGYTSSRMFTDSMGWILLGGALCMGLSLVATLYFRKKREIIPITTVHAPEGMDPLKMGVWLDGNADTEDVTSMVYYFADQGYLKIDLQDEDDPLLIKEKEIPDDAPIYQKTLFKGLFKKREMRVSELAHKFYNSAQRAKMQVAKPQMYEKKSIFGFVLGGALAVIYVTLTLLLMGAIHIGGGYTYLLGISFAVPVIAILGVSAARENYRYKLKAGLLGLLLVVPVLIAAIACLIYVSAVATHIVTGWEMLVLCICAFASVFITSGTLSRKEKYVKELGDILGFKEFILYTEKDRLKELLEDMPELFYHVLPYAQVLGVSDQWEDKFRGLTLEPPSWCVGYRMSLFDYMILNRCMRRAMITAMQPPNNGGKAGYSGGGGSFGGFGGGGFGGGGGGAR